MKILVTGDLAKLTGVRPAISEIQRKHKFLDCIFINAGLGYLGRHPDE
jgi:hypothetical protein